MEGILETKSFCPFRAFIGAEWANGEKHYRNHAIAPKKKRVGLAPDKTKAPT